MHIHWAATFTSQTIIYSIIICSIEMRTLSKIWKNMYIINWAPSSEFVSSSIPSWQIITAHAQSFRRARDLAFCLKVPLHSLLVWASSEGSGETAQMRRLAWTFAARICDKYQIRLTRSNYCSFSVHKEPSPHPPVYLEFLFVGW